MVTPDYPSKDDVFQLAAFTLPWVYNLPQILATLN